MTIPVWALILICIAAFIAGYIASPGSASKEMQSQIKGLQEDTSAIMKRVEHLADRLEKRVDRSVEGVSEKVQSRIDDLEGNLREALGNDGLQEVKGIGEKRAESLEEAGYDTLDALASADAKQLSEDAGVSQERAENWIRRAREL